ncbi:MAG: hypothetical protein ACJ8GN_18880 [Longimicrobiaceae bacterium]
MKKLTLQLDDLQIESFSTLHEPVTSEGTVQGFITLYCESNSCQWCATLSDCETGCGCGTRFEGGTCEYATCAPTCAGWTCEYDTCGDCHTSNIC